MGFFSKIVKFIKDVIKDIVSAIAKLFNGIFGSPIVAALAMFVIGFMIMGPLAFQAMVANPVAFLSQTMTLTMFVATSMVVGGALSLISAICPPLGKVLGFVFGLLSFINMGLQIANFFYPQLAQNLMVQQLLGLGTYQGTAIANWFSIANAIGTATFLASLAEGVDENGDPQSAFVRGWVDGLLAVPEVVGDVADGVVDAATDAIGGLLPYVAAGFGLYLLFRQKPASTVIQVDGKAQGVLNAPA